MEYQNRSRGEKRAAIDWDDFGSLPAQLARSQIGGNVFLRPQTRLVRTAQSEVACTIGSEWLVAPTMSIEHAEYKGWHLVPEESTVYWFFRLDIKISGTLLCKECGGSTTRPIEIFVTIPLSYGQHTLLLVMPFRIKLFINAIRAAQAGGKLVKFLMDNKEIIEYLLKFLDPMMILVRNSAALLCASRLDPNGLQQQIQKYIDDNTRMIGPPSYEPQMA